MNMYIVDRFEGDMAVLEGDGGVMRDIPIRALPAGVKQGDVLTEEHGAFRVDRDATQRRAESIHKQMRDLFENQ